MKARIKNYVNRFGLTSLVLVAALFWNAGCATHPDPLAGWQVADYNAQPNETIVKDYQNYIQSLPPKEKQFIQGGITFYKDETGQHAIKIVIPYYGVWREHVLIYDKDNTRIKVITYSGGRYAS